MKKKTGQKSSQTPDNSGSEFLSGTLFSRHVKCLCWKSQYFSNQRINMHTVGYTHPQGTRFKTLSECAVLLQGRRDWWKQHRATHPGTGSCLKAHPLTC